MKKIYLLAFVATFLFGNTQAQDNKSTTRIVGSFSKLIVNSPLTITIIPGTDEKVVLTTDDPTFGSYINTNSNGSDLLVEVKNKPKNMNASAAITIYCKSLNSIIVNKQCDITFASKLTSKKLNIELNDKSKINNATFSVTDFSIDAKSASKATLSVENCSNVEVSTKSKSDITINGVTQKLSLDATKESTIDATGLQATKIAVNSSDNSVVSILSNDKFDVNVNNAQVKVKGNGQPNKKNIKGSGGIVQL